MKKRFFSILLCMTLLLCTQQAFTLSVSAAGRLPALVGSIIIIEDPQIEDEELCEVCVYLDAADAEYTFGVEVEKGTVYGMPAEPAREDAVFAGWYTDRALTKPYNNIAPITENTDLFAKWIPIGEVEYCDVYIYLDAAFEEPVSGFDWPKGGVLGFPDAPGRDDDEFGGWYTDRALTKPYDHTAPITENTNLFPKWIPLGSYVLGDLNGDGSVSDADAVYLLFFTFFPADYPVNQRGDFNADGVVSDADAIYLLFYTFFPDDYPLVS